jgi:Arc/MetJ-type ribon-helix-helix transcriptional regulator
VYTEIVMGTISLSLSLDVEQFVTKKVGSGQYATKDEVVNAIVRKQMRREWELAWIKQKIAISQELARRGELAQFEAEKMKAEGQKRLAALEGQL